MNDNVAVDETQPRYNRIIRAMVWVIGLGAMGYLSAVVWVGWGNAVQAFSAIGWIKFIIAVVICSSSYAWRYARWEHILIYFGYRLPRTINVAIYLSGLALTATPGKSGETFRSFLLLQSGVRVHQSLAAFITDRATDVLGMVLLGTVSAWLTGSQSYWFWFAVLLAMLLISRVASLIILSRRGSSCIGWLVGYFNLGVVNFGVAFAEAWASVWKFRRVIPYTIFALIAYGSQALVFAWLCSYATTTVTAPQAVLMFVQANLFGAASMMPGGIGAMEASLIYQLVEHDVELSVAISLAVLIRVATLWVGLCVGVVALVYASRSVGVVELGQK